MQVEIVQLLSRVQSRKGREYNYTVGYNHAWWESANEQSGTILQGEKVQIHSQVQSYKVRKYNYVHSRELLPIQDESKF